MLMRDLPLHSAPSNERRLRELSAAALRLASRALDRVAQRLALVHAEPDTEPSTTEFYADAAAPEGALYVNGQLVGRVLGVTRL